MKKKRLLEMAHPVGFLQILRTNSFHSCSCSSRQEAAVVKVLIYKSRGGLSLLVQPKTHCVFLAYFDRKKQTLMLFNFLVRTLQCTETLILYLSPRENMEKTPSKLGYFIKIAEKFLYCCATHMQ